MGNELSGYPGVVINYAMPNAQTWVAHSARAPVPPFAVVGGHDADNTPIFVGRSYHAGEYLPAKVVPSKHSAYVPYDGKEIVVGQYEILVGQGYGWVPAIAGGVPPLAVQTGTTRTGEPLYVGRGHHAGSLCVGKVHPSHGCLYIPFGGHEVRLNTYEVLVQQPQERWVSGSGGHLPPGAVVAGYDTDRTSIYVGRAQHDGEWLPAKVVPSHRCGYVCSRGQEINKQQYEVLTGPNYSWARTMHHAIPANAVSTGRSRSGEPLYVGRGHHEGSLTPGVVLPSQRCLYIPYGGREIRIDSYEVLIRQ